MFNNRLFRAAVAALLVTLSACDLFGPDDAGSTMKTSAILVANGGNFGDQNGFISSYDPSTGTVSEGASLNGFLQGMTLHDGRLYTLLNTFSVGRIDILDASTLVQIGQIADIQAPRAMAIAGNTAWISNLIFGANGTLIPVALGTGTLGPGIEVGRLPEGVLAFGGRVYVANSGNLGDGSTLSVVDSDSSTARTVDLDCDGPRDLYADPDGEIIVLCSGTTVYSDDYSEIISTTHGSILFVDAATETIVGRIELDTQLGATNGTTAGYISYGAAELYAMDGATNTIYRIDTDRNELDATFVLPPSNGLIGISGMAYDETAESLYVGRFPMSSAGPWPDFTASGTVLILDREGAQIRSFDVGPAPSQILIMSTEE